MKIAIYSITRDRLDYTKECFASLRANAGQPFDHFVIDNGSQDGTLRWLRNEYKPTAFWYFGENRGISLASNFALRAILNTFYGTGRNYDLICKIDNDCLITTPAIFNTFKAIYATDEAQRWVLSPRVEGINRQPKRVRQHQIAGYQIGVTAIVGGLFHVVPAAIYREFMADGGYDESLPLAHGQDDQFMDWLARKSYAKGYVEEISVQHYRGTDQQAKDYPEYFERKWAEERQP